MSQRTDRRNRRAERASACRGPSCRPPRWTALVVLAVVLAGCSSTGLRAEIGTLVAGEDVEVAVDGGWVGTEVGDGLPEGARVRTGEDEARLDLRGGQVWLKPGSLALLREGQVDVVRGDALVRSDGAMQARSSDVEVRGEAVYRLVPGVAPRVGVYRGEVQVRRPGETRSVPALREVSLGDVRLPQEPAPLAYRPDDPWDRALLPQAVAFDVEVERLARGIDRQYGPEPRAADFYESFLAVEPDTIPLLVSISRTVTADGRFGPPSDALVTLFVGQAVASAHDRDADTSVREVARLRSERARWGLIAVELDIGTVDLQAAVNLGQERRLAAGVSGAPGGSEAAPSPASPRPTQERARSADAGTPQAAPRGAPAPPPRQGPEPEPEPEPEPTEPDPGGDGGALDEAVDVVDGVVEDVVDGLVGGDGLLR